METKYGLAKDGTRNELINFGLETKTLPTKLHLCIVAYHKKGVLWFTENKVQWKEERRRLLRNSLSAGMQDQADPNIYKGVLTILLPLDANHIESIAAVNVCRGRCRTGLNPPVHVLTSFWDIHRRFRESYILQDPTEVTNEELASLKSYIDTESCLHGCEEQLLLELFKDIKTDCTFIKRKERSGTAAFYTTCWLGKRMISSKVWENEKRNQTKILCIILCRYGAFWRHCYKDTRNKLVSGAVPKDPSTYIRFLQQNVKHDSLLKQLAFEHCFQGWPTLQRGFEKPH